MTECTAPTLLLGLFSRPPHEYSVEQLSEMLNVPVLSQAPECHQSGAFVLVIDQQGLAIAFTGKSAPNPIRIDFSSGSAAHRRLYGGGKGQLIVKAIGIKTTFRPHVLDLTAGLGQDAFVLATQGCRVNMVERSPLIYSLLDDGLARVRKFSDDSSLVDIIDRMSLVLSDSLHYLKNIDFTPDVIYLDPMFPESNKRALVKKSMQAFHQLVGDNSDAGALLVHALQIAKYRVVVKRPRKAPTMNEQYAIDNVPSPNLIVEGKSSRYDVYPLLKMPSH